MKQKKRKEKEESSQSIFRLVPKYMYVYTHLGLWLDWLLLLLLLGSFTSRLHSFPLPPSPSLYTLDQYFTYIRVLRKKKIIFSWSCGVGSCLIFFFFFFFFVIFFIFL